MLWENCRNLWSRYTVHAICHAREKLWRLFSFTLLRKKTHAEVVQIMRSDDNPLATILHSRQRHCVSNVPWIMTRTLSPTTNGYWLPPGFRCPEHLWKNNQIQEQTQDGTYGVFKLIWNMRHAKKHDVSFAWTHYSLCQELPCILGLVKVKLYKLWLSV
jgi:hypothetical protein